MKSFEMLLPQDYDPRLEVWRAEDLPLDIPALKVRGDDGQIYSLDDERLGLSEVQQAALELRWRYGMNISRAIGLLLEKHGYKEAVSYDRLGAVILDGLCTGEKALIFEPGTINRAIERGLLARRDGMLFPTALGTLIRNILPPDLRSREEYYRIDTTLADIAEDPSFWPGGCIPADLPSAADFLAAELDRLPGYIAEILSAKIEPHCEDATLCPTCGGYAARSWNGKAGWHWRCQDKTCNAWFPDDHGKLARPVACPTCGEVYLCRFERRQKHGHYWHCGAKGCDAFFHDDSGRVGEPFGDEPQ